MTYSRGDSPFLHSYDIDGKVLSRVNQTKDLGVIFDSRLTYRQHIYTLVENSYKLLGFVMRNMRQFNNTFVMCLLFNSLIRSRLEVNAAIWSPYENSYISRLERVQKRFLRFLYFKQYGYYPFLYPTAFILGMVGYNSLSVRRDWLAICHIYKLLRGFVDNPIILRRIGLFVPANYCRARTHVLFALPRARTNIVQHCFTVRTLRTLNALCSADLELDIWTVSLAQLQSTVMAFLSNKEIT